MAHRSNYMTALAFFVTISCLTTLVAAQRDSGASRTDRGQCPDDAEQLMVYSPFVPYFKFDFFKGNAQKCWVAAGKTLSMVQKSIQLKTLRLSF